MPSTADELEAIRQLKARYCRYLDTRDVDGWRGLFAPDLTVLLDGAVSTAGADPQTGPPIEGVDNFVPMVLGTLEGVATVHHCHTPEIELTSPGSKSDFYFSFLRRAAAYFRDAPPSDDDAGALGTCTRCGACIPVCPMDCIVNFYERAPEDEASVIA